MPNLSRTLFPHPLGKPILRMMILVVLLVTYSPEIAWGLDCSIGQQEQIHLYNRSGNYVGNLQGPRQLWFARTDYTCNCPPNSDLCSCINRVQFYNRPGSRSRYVRIEGTGYYFNQSECNNRTSTEPIFSLSNVSRNRKRRFTCKNPKDCEAKLKQ